MPQIFHMLEQLRTYPPLVALSISALLPPVLFLVLLLVEYVIRSISGYRLRRYDRSSTALVSLFLIYFGAVGLADSIERFPAYPSEILDALPLRYREVVAIVLLCFSMVFEVGVFALLLNPILRKLPRLPSSDPTPSRRSILFVFIFVAVGLWMLLTEPGDPTTSLLAHTKQALQDTPFKYLGYTVVFLAALWLAGVIYEDVNPVITVEDARFVSSATTPNFESPIERLFWEEWQRQGGSLVLDLVYQYQDHNTRNRIDFAHLPTMTAIELDGYEYHSSKEQFTRDRKRQRELERFGWRFIRFSGSEIVRSVSDCFREVLAFVHASHPSDDAVAMPTSSPTTTRLPRTRNEMVEKLESMVRSRTFNITTIGDKTLDEMTLEEVYSVAAEDIAFNEVMGQAVPGITGATLGSDSWLYWLEVVEGAEKRYTGAA